MQDINEFSEDNAVIRGKNIFSGCISWSSTNTGMSNPADRKIIRCHRILVTGNNGLIFCFVNIQGIKYLFSLALLNITLMSGLLFEAVTNPHCLGITLPEGFTLNDAIWRYCTNQCDNIFSLSLISNAQHSNNCLDLFSTL